MELDLCGERAVKNPTPELIALELERYASRSDFFAVLATSPMTYLQTAGNQEELYALEYQDGSTNRHFETTRKRLSLLEVQQAFERYIKGDTRWKSEFEWRRIEVRNWRVVGFWLCLALIFILFLVSRMIERL